MKISASIYSSISNNIIELIKNLEKVDIDFIHIDFDGSKDILNDVKEIRKISNKPIDLHLITSSPQKYYNFIIEEKIEFVTFQYENLIEPLKIPENIHAKIGLAITTKSSIDVFEYYKDICDFILFMTTEPGKSGGIFDEKNFDRIKKFKKKYSNKRIHVDGGVNEEVSFILRNLGVYCAVSGSFLVNNQSHGEAILKLKSEIKNVHYKVKDFMLKLNELPILYQNELNLKNLLLKIEEYKLGFCIVVDSSKKIMGIITDGDIRRFLLSNMNLINNIDIDEILNKNATVIQKNDTISDMLKVIEDNEKVLIFIPVVSSNGIIEGAISFNNLIRGEL